MMPGMLGVIVPGVLEILVVMLIAAMVFGIPIAILVLLLTKSEDRGKILRGLGIAVLILVGAVLVARVLGFAVFALMMPRPVDMPGPHVVRNVALGGRFLVLLPVLVIAGVVIWALAKGAKSGNAGRVLAGILGIGVLVALLGFAALAATRLHDGAGLSKIGPVDTKIWLLVALVAAPIVVLVAILRSGKAKPALAAILGVAVVAALLIAGFFTLAHVRVERADVVTPYPPDAPVMVREALSSVAHDVPPIWHEGVELEMPADVYPSLDSAVRALARRAEGLIQKALAGEPMPDQVLIYQTSENSGIVHAFRRELKDRLGVDARIVQQINASPPTRDETAVVQHLLTFKLRVENDRFHYIQGDDAETRQRTGLLDLTVKGPAAVADAQVEYHEKPWLVDFASFQSKHRDRSYIIARSTTSATSKAQAEGEALDQAARRAAEIIDRMRARTPDRLLGPSFKIDAISLQQRGLVLDRFNQRFYGAAGPIWRSAVLVDISPDKFQPLVDDEVSVMRVERLTWARMLLTLLGLGVLITVVYVFLDVATRGYYTWSLRVAAILLAAAGVVLVLLMS